MTSHLKTFELCPVKYAIAVFQAELDPPFNDWTQQHINQGFSWREGSVSFQTVGSLNILIEVWLTDEITLLPHTQRAIQVPFRVTDSGQVGISDILGVGEDEVKLPTGTYLLLFENGFRYDVECSSEDDACGLRPMWCRLTFLPCSTSQPEVLREEPGLPENNLAPIYPLLMEAKAA